MGRLDSYKNVIKKELYSDNFWINTKDTGFKRKIRGMIYTTNRIERLNRDYKRVISMRGTMPNPQAVILLMETVAQNADIYKYPIYNFFRIKIVLLKINRFAKMKKKEHTHF